MDQKLKDLLDKVKDLPPLTKQQIMEQRVSWVYGQLGGVLTKEQVRESLERSYGS